MAEINNINDIVIPTLNEDMLDGYVETPQNKEEINPIIPEDVARIKSLSANDRKERYIQYLLSMQELDFYQKHNFMMDGKTRRHLRKQISNKVINGYIKVPDDIDLNNYEAENN